MAEPTPWSTKIDAFVEPRSSFRPVANACSAGSCPTVYVDESGTVVVQGFDITPEQVGVDVPAGEGLVRVPLALLVEAVRSLS